MSHLISKDFSFKGLIEIKKTSPSTEKFQVFAGYLPKAKSLFSSRSGSSSSSHLRHHSIVSTLCWPHDCSPKSLLCPWRLQPRILEWVCLLQRSFQPRYWTQVYHMASDSYHLSHQRSPNLSVGKVNILRCSTVFTSKLSFHTSISLFKFVPLNIKIIYIY